MRQRTIARCSSEVIAEIPSPDFATGEGSWWFLRATGSDCKMFHQLGKAMTTARIKGIAPHSRNSRRQSIVKVSWLHDQDMSMVKMLYMMLLKTKTWFPLLGIRSCRYIHCRAVMFINRPWMKRTAVKTIKFPAVKCGKVIVAKVTNRRPMICIINNCFLSKTSLRLQGGNRSSKF